MANPSLARLAYLGVSECENAKNRWALLSPTAPPANKQAHVGASVLNNKAWRVGLDCPLFSCKILVSGKWSHQMLPRILRCPVCVRFRLNVLPLFNTIDTDKPNTPYPCESQMDERKGSMKTCNLCQHIRANLDAAAECRVRFLHDNQDTQTCT